VLAGAPACAAAAEIAATNAAVVFRASIVRSLPSRPTREVCHDRAVESRGWMRRGSERERGQANPEPDRRDCSEAGDGECAELQLGGCGRSASWVGLKRGAGQ
jgi:hypothetical protein